MKEQKTSYIAPQMEVIDVQVEFGFAQSGENQRFSEDPGDGVAW